MTLQNNLVQYRKENQYLIESFIGLQNELHITTENFEEQSEAYIEVSEDFV